MVETRIDPLAAFLPMGTRPAPPAVAFASYLNQAWSFTTTTAPLPAPHSTMDSNARHPTAPLKPFRDDGSSPEAGGDDRRNDRTDAAAPEGEAETHCTASDAVSTPAETVAEGDTPPPPPHEDGGRQESATDGTEDRADAPEDAVSKTEPDSDAPVIEHDAAHAAGLADAAVGQATDSDIPGERPPADSTTAELSQSQTEQKALAKGEAGSDTSSGEGESGAAGGGSSELQETMDGNRGEPDPNKDSDEAPASNERGSRQRRARTAREAAPARAARQADSHQPSASGNASEATVSAASNVAAGLTATDAIAAPVDAGHPATITTTTVSTSPGDQAGPGATVAARPGAATSGEPETDQAGAVDRVRFVQRVARAFQAMGDRSGTVRLRLSPPELGALRIEITVNRGVMDARLEAETEVARQLLLDNLPMLRERLAGQNIKVEHFQVDLSDRQPGGPSGWSDGRPEPDQTSAGQRGEPVNRTSDSEEADPAGHARVHRTGQPSQLDIFV